MSPVRPRVTVFPKLLVRSFVISVPSLLKCSPVSAFWRTVRPRLLDSRIWPIKYSPSFPPSTVSSSSKVPIPSRNPLIKREAKPPSLNSETKGKIMTSDSNNQAQQAIIAAANKGHITQISSQALLANLNANTVPSTIGSQVQLLESGTPLVLNIVVDSTGSLSGFEKVIIKAINDTAGDFKKMRNKTGQEMYLCIMEFSTRNTITGLRVIQDFIHVQDFVELTLNDYNTGGLTPLFDPSYDGITPTMAFG